MAYKLTLLALEAGFRNFFASVLANNQKGFARAIRDSGIPREDLYICGTVLSNRAQGEEKAFKKTKQGCEENIMAFSTGNIDYLDMIMLDYPG
jgi:diketogulonate reductase-like aldo/keto reductase